MLTKKTLPVLTVAELLFVFDFYVVSESGPGENRTHI